MGEQNVGPLDRGVRGVLGILLLYLGWFVLGGNIGAIRGDLVLIIGAYILITAITGKCFFYSLLNIRTGT